MVSCRLLLLFIERDSLGPISTPFFRYFVTLQKDLEQYDCVLYEMVASRESLESRRNPAAKKRMTCSRGFNILGCIQR
ncbi:hypothetical protein D5086_013131 [Populus alba]|uniref:Uncharacterized protein n=1 Tax=Populus alba TaxID=43335 RepID=A0ACC4C436_POPAL